MEVQERVSQVETLKEAQMDTSYHHIRYHSHHKCRCYAQRFLYFLLLLFSFGISASALADSINIKLIHGQSDSVITDQRIDVYKLLPDGKKAWVTKGVTDAQGKVNFSIEALGSGTKYVAYAKVFNSFRAKAYFSKGGNLTFKVGTSRVDVRGRLCVEQTPACGY